MNRRNFFIKSIASLLYFTISGCAKASNLSLIQNKKGYYKLSDSPNFNNSTKRFEHPAGDLYDKSFGDLFDYFTDYFRRADDEWESTGFPLLKGSSNELFSPNTSSATSLPTPIILYPWLESAIK